MKRPLSESDWTATPEPVQRHVESLEQRIEKLEESIYGICPRIQYPYRKILRTLLPCGFVHHRFINNPAPKYYNLILLRRPELDSEVLPLWRRDY